MVDFRMSDGVLTANENQEIDDIFSVIGCSYPKVKRDFKVRYSKLKSEDQRRLILDLTRRFTFIPLAEYGSQLQLAVNKFLRSVKSDKMVAVMNGLSQSEYGKINSNYLVSYQFKGLNITQNVDWGSKSVSIIDDIKTLLELKSKKEVELLLVDDFIGSGETIEGAYNEIRSRFQTEGKQMPHVSVICIVAMQQAIDLLGKMGIGIFASKIEKRGISDFYTGDDLTKALFKKPKDNSMKRAKEQIYSEIKRGVG